MSTDRESRHTTNNQLGRGTEEPGPIARSLAARAQWTQRVLSPWVQRWLQASASPETGREGHFARHFQTALTATNTNLLLDRVQCVVDRGTVWRADVGSLEPAMVARFTSAIVDRFPAVGAKYEPQPLDTGSAEATDLILVDNAIRLGLGGRELSPESGRGRAEAPGPLPSMAALREAWEARSRSPESPPVPGRALPRIQRTATESPRTRQPTHTLPPQSRLFSRVEELPDEKTLEEQRPPEVEARPTTTPGRPEAAPEPSRPVQRQPDRTVSERERPRPAEAPPPETEVSAAQAVEAEPPRPPEEGPAVQRRLDRMVSERLRPAEGPPPETEAVAAEPSPPEERPAVQRPPGRAVSEREQPRLPVEAPLPEKVSAAQAVEVEPLRPPGRAVSEREQPRPPEGPPPEVEAVAAQAVEAEPPRPPEARPAVQRRPDRAVPEREQPRPAEGPPPEVEAVAAQAVEAEPPRPPAQRPLDRVVPEREQPRLAEGPPPEVEAVTAQAVEAEPPRPEEVTPGRAARPPQPGPPAEQPAVQRQPELAESLEQEVLTRAVSRVRLPLTEPLLPRWAKVSDRAPELPRFETLESLTGPEHKLPRVALTRPKASPQTPILRLPGAQVQARFEPEAEEASSQIIPDRFRPQPPPDSWATPHRPMLPLLERVSQPEWMGEVSELPLPVVSRPPLPVLVQRQPLVSPARPDMISRQEQVPAETAEAASETEEPAEREQDLDHLARQIYPLIKRMLAVERERRSARWDGRM